MGGSLQLKAASFVFLAHLTASEVLITFGDSNDSRRGSNARQQVGYEDPRTGQDIVIGLQPPAGLEQQQQQLQQQQLQQQQQPAEERGRALQPPAQRPAGVTGARRSALPIVVQEKIRNDTFPPLLCQLAPSGIDAPVSLDAGMCLYTCISRQIPF